MADGTKSGSFTDSVTGSIFIWQHDGDCGLRVVHIECATSGDQFHKTRGAVVVANVERKRQAAVSLCCFADGKAEHPDNIPKPSGFVLPAHAGRHGHISVKDATREKDRKADSRLLCRLAHVNLKA